MIVHTTTGNSFEKAGTVLRVQCERVLVLRSGPGGPP